jgi:hypothetical protein
MQSSTKTFESLHNSTHPKIGDNLRGEYGETIARLFFIQNGFRVSESGGDWYPYDLIVDRHGECFRVQVKTAARTCRSYFRSWFSLSDDFDLAFVVAEPGDCYLIPFDDLRFENPRSGSKNARRFTLYPRYKPFHVARFGGFTTTADLANVDEIVGL